VNRRKAVTQLNNYYWKSKKNFSMGGCVSGEDYRKGDSVTNGNHGSGSDEPNPPSKPRGKTKKNHFETTIGSEIRADPLNPDHASSQSIILPDNPEFHCSINGRNGWLVHEVYNLGETVRSMRVPTIVTTCQDLNFFLRLLMWISLYIHFLYLQHSQYPSFVTVW
jgi:hypothetical protein